MMRVSNAQRSSGVNPLTLAAVPTGMKAGVSTSPCASESVPCRAEPSRARRMKVPGAFTWRAFSRVGYCEEDVDGRHFLRLGKCAGEFARERRNGEGAAAGNHHASQRRVFAAAVESAAGIE